MDGISTGSIGVKVGPHVNTTNPPLVLWERNYPASKDQQQSLFANIDHLTSTVYIHREHGMVS